MRNVNMRDVDCEHCPYYYEFKPEEVVVFTSLFGTAAASHISGNCRRNPPAFTGDGNSVGHFPTTIKTGWCGHHPDFDV